MFRIFDKFLVFFNGFQWQRSSLATSHFLLQLHWNQKWFHSVEPFEKPLQRPDQESPLFPWTISKQFTAKNIQICKIKILSLNENYRYFYQVVGIKHMTMMFIEFLGQISKISQILWVLTSTIDIGDLVLADYVLHNQL